MVDAEAKILPIMPSTFIMSRSFSPLCSGLMIELSDAPHGLDEHKQKRWVNDLNFPFYRNAASKHGFFVDKNAPWRLVADVGSSTMREYMEPYGLETTEELFKTYYYRTYRYDIETLKRHLVDMYAAFVVSYPNFKVFKTKLKGAGGVQTVSRLVSRRVTSLNEVDRQYGPDFWLKTYYYIRLREIGNPLKPVDFNKEVKKIFQINKTFDFDKALDYINDNVNKLSKAR